MVYHPNGSLIHQQSTLRLMEVDLVSSFVLTGAENKEVSEETTTGAFFAFSTTPITSPARHHPHGADRFESQPRRTSREEVEALTQALRIKDPQR